MLASLSIRNIVLIDKLDVTFERGMTVLTGETGAGKSILLDALNLALGERAQVSLIRPGESHATVIAEFDVGADEGIKNTLEEAGLDFEDRLVLRRSLSRDGKSRAFINDQPVSLALLGDLSSRLIEIHGQFDKLLSPSTHTDLLDDFGVHDDARERTKTSFAAWIAAKDSLKEAEASLAASRTQADFWRYALDELERLAPKQGEVESLEAERQFLQNRAKIVEYLTVAFDRFSSEDGIDAQFSKAYRGIERAHSLAPDKFMDLFDIASRLSEDISAANRVLSTLLTEDEGSVERLNLVESRLFDLSEIARKHQCQIDELENLLIDFKDKVSKIEAGDEALNDLRQALALAEKTYLKESTNLTQIRIKTAERLDTLVNQELPPLKLEAASFKTEILPLQAEKWHERGADRVEFMVRTNPGHPFGGLGKIASGGELSRFMLALKVILAHEGYVSTLIFDEIDSGVSGGVASAIGDRLARLGSHVQVFAITHSALVAAAADQHYTVVKNVQSEAVSTQLIALSKDEREREVARLIGGDTLTDAAVETAKSLLHKRGL